MLKKFIVLVLASVAFLGALPLPAAAQTYPNRAIRLIVPNAPGGAPDLISRIMAPPMSKLLDQPVVVENRTGAQALLGFEHVALEQPADGYTFLMVPVIALSLFPVTVKDMPFDPLTDLPLFISMVEGRAFIGSPTSVPWHTFPEFISALKANPGKYNYGVSSPEQTLTIEALLGPYNVKITRVPYSSDGTLSPGLLTNEVQFRLAAATVARGYGDKFRRLGVTGDTRDKDYPDVPTMAELGTPGLNNLSYAFAARKGTPKVAIDKLTAAASAALKMPEVQAQFAKANLEIHERSAEDAEKNFRSEAALFENIAKKIGFQPE